MATRTVLFTDNLQTLVTAGAAGDIYQFLPGIYRGQRVTAPKNNIQFQGDAGGGTVISGAVLIEGWQLLIQSGSNSQTQGIYASAQTFTRITTQSANQPTGSAALYGEEVFINNKRLIPSLGATFVASTSGSSTTLTIASSSAGQIQVGSLIAGNGIAAGTRVIDYGTYTGGTTGTVIMSQANTVAASTTVTASAGPLVSGQWFWGTTSGTTGKILIADNPIGATVEIAQTLNFFVGGGLFSGEVMNNLTIEKFASPGLASPYAAVQAGPGSTYTNCTFQYIHSEGIEIFSTNVTITGCRFLYCGQEGWAGSACGGVVFKYNEVAYCGNANFNGNTGTVPVSDGGAYKIGNTQTTNTVSYNYFHDNQGAGPWSDINDLNSFKRHNLVANHSQSGITCEISGTEVIQANVVVRSGLGMGQTGNPAYPAGILLTNCGSVTVDSNYVETAANSGAALSITWASDRTTDPGSQNNPSVNVTNNTFVLNDATAKIGWTFYAASTGQAVPGTWSGNTYIVPATGANHWGWQDNTLISFATWKSSHSLDTVGSTETAYAIPGQTTTWPQMAIKSDFEDSGIALVNTSNAPCSLFGGSTGQIFEPGAWAWPSHIWFNQGTNSLFIRSGCSGMVVHDWAQGGTNSIYVLGYTFANVAAVLSAMANVGSNVVLTLTDSKTVTFWDTTTAAFSSSNVFIAESAPANIPQSVAALLSSFASGGNPPINGVELRQFVATALAQGTEAPTSLTWTAGQFVWNTSKGVYGPVGAQYSIVGWRCIVSGTPGQWVPVQGFTGS